MKHEAKIVLHRWLLEVVMYAALVAAYYFLVLHFLGNGLKDIYEQDRRYYAGLALGLIVGQGFLLEMLTRLLLRWMTPRTED